MTRWQRIRDAVGRLGGSLAKSAKKSGAVTGRVGVSFGVTILLLIFSYEAGFFSLEKPQNLLGIFSAILFLWFLVSVTLSHKDLKSGERYLPTHQAMVVLEFLSLGLLLVYFLSVLQNPPTTITNAPLGIVTDIQGNKTEWVVNIGGTNRAGAYQGGLQIPLYIIVLGALGAFVNFLSKMENIMNIEEVISRIKRQWKQDTGQTQFDEKDEANIEASARLEKQREAILVLGEFFLAPLLAVGVYLLLVQGGSTSALSLGVAALAVGLTVHQITMILSRSLQGVLGEGKDKQGRTAKTDGGKNT